MKLPILKLDLWQQFKRVLPTLLKVYLPFLILLFIAVIQERYTGFSFKLLVADAYEYTGLSPFLGFITHLGILIFCATSAICFFTAYQLKQNASSENSSYAYFLLFSGLIVLVLMLDDWLAIHEKIPYAFLSLFITFKKTQARGDFLELMTFAFYGFIIMLYLYKFWRVLIQTEYMIIFIGLFFFAISLSFDVLHGFYILEEGFKLLGIASFSTYYIRLCNGRLNI